MNFIVTVISSLEMLIKLKKGGLLEESKNYHSLNRVIRTVVNHQINYDPLLQTVNEFNQLLIITL